MNRAPTHHVHDPRHVLWYDRPARFWEEALPLGNGRLGAMIFAEPDRDRLQLNEDTIWSGLPGIVQPNAIRAELPAIRQLLAQGKYSQATEAIDAALASPEGKYGDTQSYQMAGDLFLEFAPSDARFDYYRRELDLRTAIARTTFRRESACHAREVFVSAPAQVIVMRLSVERPAGLSFDLTADTEMHKEIEAQGDCLILRGQCPYSNHSREREGQLLEWERGGRAGIRYQVHACAEPLGGAVQAQGERLRIEDAEEVVLFIAIETDFEGFDKMPGQSGRDLAAACRQRIDAARAKGYEALREEHIAEHRTRYDRMTFHIDGPASEASTYDRLKQCDDPAGHPDLVSLLFNFGRYLLISSSRPGTQPANLQGIWNAHLLPPWRCNYTTNINLEMNYWPAEACNLADCAEPLFKMIEELSQSGAHTAQDMYDASGWCVHHNSDLWRYSRLGGRATQCSYWPVCGPWLCQHLWEHYRYGLDKAFLRETAWPLMRGAAQFLLDFLIEDAQGHLVTSPATSPENVFTDPATGKKAAACEGSAMDLSLVRELFENCIAAAEILDTEPDFARQLRQALSRLKPHATGSEGQLLEFGGDWQEPEMHHRHVSHLYGAYPGWEFTPTRNRALWDAARVSLERRGDRSTGWAMGWRVALWARFLDGDRALRVVGELLRLVDPSEQRVAAGGGMYPNFLCAHPPFQIDGNFGATAALTEMLVQSHESDEGGRPLVRILPALPAAWQSGRVEGLRVRGGFTVDMEWREGCLTRCAMTSAAGAPATVVYGERREVVSPQVDETTDIATLLAQ